MIESAGYEFLIEKYGEERIREAYEWMFSSMDEYVYRIGKAESCLVSETILDYVIVDFFTDIFRLKSFHTIDNPHDTKVYSYMAFWTIRHKPIQTICNDEELAFVNEEFVTEWIRGYLCSVDDAIALPESNRGDIDNFFSTLLYYLKYRSFSAQSLEGMLLAFLAGRNYQYLADHQK